MRHLGIQRLKSVFWGGCCRIFPFCCRIRARMLQKECAYFPLFTRKCGRSCRIL
nr:MAG TPA: hypothetical protein [Caudoviricetes sp.]